MRLLRWLGSVQLRERRRGAAQGAVAYALFLAAAILGSDPASACVYDPGPAALPGEGGADLSARRTALAQHLAAESERRQQIARFDGADRISLARVISSGVRRTMPLAPNGDFLREAFVRPIASIKGALGSASVALAERGGTSCGIVGDGSPARAVPGTYLILFEGAPIDKESGVYGILLSEIRDQRLWDALRPIANKLSANRP